MFRKKPATMTTAAGKTITDDTNSLSAGQHGSILLEDTALLEKLAHFNRERIPERVVHAKGAGAYGIFTVTSKMSKYTSANFLGRTGRKTEVFVRFSTVGGGADSADAERDPRGFAIKFYTSEGNYDLVGNNTPVFFIRDPMKFPDFIHSQKKNPQTGCKDADAFWDFLTLNPESAHQTMILFSDRGIPADYRHMNGYGSHTFKWYNDAGETFYVKYHLKSCQSIKNLTEDEAEQIRGANADHATEDLFKAIAAKNFPAWTMYVQIMTAAEAENFSGFDIFDVTKVWPHKAFPLREVGTLTLNRNVENYFCEVEQAAFSPGNFVPGITASPDKLLQGRIFAYHDAHRYRLGANYTQIPVNRPKCEVHNYQAGGRMNITPHHPKGVNFFPNSMHGPAPDATSGNDSFHGHASSPAGRFKAAGDDDFSQPGIFYEQVMDDAGRQRMLYNICSHLAKAGERIKLRSACYFAAVNQELGGKIAEQLQLDLKQYKALSALPYNQAVEETK